MLWGSGAVVRGAWWEAEWTGDDSGEERDEKAENFCGVVMSHIHIQNTL